MPVIRRIVDLFHSINHYLILPSTKKWFFIKKDIFYLLPSFKHRRTFYPLASLNKFSKIHIATIIENKNFYGYKLNNNIIQELLKYKLEYYRTCIIHLFSKYKSFSDNMLLKGHDQIITINTKFNNWKFEELTISLTNLKYANKEFLNISFFKNKVNEPCIKAIGNTVNYYTNLEGKTKQLMDYTSPGKNGCDIQIFVQNNSSYDNSASRNNNPTFGWNKYDPIYELFSNNTSLTLPHNSDYAINESSIRNNTYPCIVAEMLVLDNSYMLYLDYNPAKLLANENYLSEIISTGRKVMLKHYCPEKDNIDFLVDNYPLGSVVTREGNSVMPIATSFYNRGLSTVVKDVKNIYPFNYTMDSYLPYSLGQQELVWDNKLTRKDAIDLREQLKVLLHQEHRTRALAGDTTKQFLFKDLHLKRINGVVTQRDNVNPFTVLLERVWNRGFSHGTNTGFPATPVMSLYQNLCLSTQNPLRDEEILSLIQELEIRRDVLYTGRNNINDISKTFYLEDLDLHLVDNKLIIDLADNIKNYWLVSVLENIYSNMEKYVGTQFRRRNLNTLIKHLRTYLDSNN